MFEVKDKLSALTHFIGMILAILGMPLLLIYQAEVKAGLSAMSSYSIFSLSMIALYGASAAYHAFQLEQKSGKILKKLDHIMIYVLIAGTYTPICVNVLPAKAGLPMLFAIWGLALIGSIFTAFWVTCPKWLSSAIYIGMGWICIFALKSIYHNLSSIRFAWLLAGGIIYTVGGIVYALKLSFLNKLHPEFGAHELFHIFVMLGSFCHYMVMFD